MRVAFVLAAALAAACGGDDGGGMTMNADSGVDSMAASVVTVTCPGSPAATVTTVNGTDSYMPMNTTIAVGDIVRFVMSTQHDVAPNPLTTSDPGLVVDYGQTKCMQFNKAGTYGMFCSAHSFAGTITVN